MSRPRRIWEQARAVYGEPEKMTVLVVEPLKEPHKTNRPRLQIHAGGSRWNISGHLSLR